MTILATGTFYSENWLITHLVPLARSSYVDKIYFVSATQLPDIPNVVQVCPPKWLTTIAGPSFSRLTTFARFALKHHPEIVLGFHLLLNGLVAKLLANFTGSHSIYICGGGKREFEGGGYATENRLYRLLGKPSQYVEDQLVDFIRDVDLTVVMGSSVRAYLINTLQVRGHVMVNPGGFDQDIYHPSDCDKQYDLILVGRLSDVKRVDRFLGLVDGLRGDFPHINAVVVGDGPSRQDLVAHADSLDLKGVVHFVGWQSDIATWLQASRIFVLTSASEGVSQAMIQAMMCGLPPIVPDVGDLADCVDSGGNGFLVESNSTSAFVTATTRLLSNERLRTEFGRAAAATGSHFTFSSATEHWDQYFSNIHPR